ncbi:MAG: Asp-tRNA(Asn)/Glu-tRNA(Gln) amidotransferase subunit GatA [Firmicutes bacterium]|nr:Asp-tRNA(Asn)/Glu-tRNA(Gln) amidotransferase subunit GatA [Bacillota bacterium]
MTIAGMSVIEILEGQGRGEFTPEEALQAHLDKIEGEDVGAFLRLCPKTSSGPGLLQGVPVALGDEICMEGVETTAGSRILTGFVPPYQAALVGKLQGAGAALVGKTNLTEFGMSFDMDDAVFQRTQNPWRPGTNPGGAAGGAAAAVAAGQAAAAVAADTGGDVRIPASFCGLVGFVPTYGRVSRYGVIQHAPSLTQVGLLARQVGDIALLLEVLAGEDPQDATTLPGTLSDLLAQAVEPKPLRIGIAPDIYRSFAGGDVCQAAANVWQRAAEELGWELVEVDLPWLELAQIARRLIAAAESSSTLARYDGVRYGYRAEDAQDMRELFSRTRAEGFGEVVKGEMLLGTYILGDKAHYEAYYLQALRARSVVSKSLQDLWGEVDFVLTPTTPELPGKRQAPPEIFTGPSNLAGLPAISLPCGLVDGLPVGVQLVAPAGEEGRLLRAAHVLERMIGFASSRNGGGQGA